MKRFRNVLAAAAAFFLLTTMMPYGAVSLTQRERITYRSIGIVVDGTEITPCDVTGAPTEPFIRNKDESTYLPVRAVAGALGLDVGWDDATSTVILNSGGRVITGTGDPIKSSQSMDAELTFRGITITLNGKTVELTNAQGTRTEPFIKDGSTYLPVRAVATALGCEIGWEDATSTITLTSSGKPRIGEVISLGSYEQDNDPENGKESIEWIVLDVKGDEVLLLSRYALDAKVYNETNEEAAWENCTLREWLNGAFFNEAFDSEEQSRIAETALQNPDSFWGYDSRGAFEVNNTGAGIDSLRYQRSGGSETTDHVFLLSIDEAKQFLGYDTKKLTRKDGSSYNGHPGMQAAATAYAAQNLRIDDSVTTKEGNSVCWWALRSPAGEGYSHSAHVDPYGGIGFDAGTGFYGRDQAIRPAMWIHLKPLEVE